MCVRGEEVSAQEQPKGVPWVELEGGGRDPPFFKRNATSTMKRDDMTYRSPEDEKRVTY